MIIFLLEVGDYVLEREKLPFLGPLTESCKTVGSRNRTETNSFSLWGQTREVRYAAGTQGHLGSLGLCILPMQGALGPTWAIL